MKLLSEPPRSVLFLASNFARCPTVKQRIENLCMKSQDCWSICFASRGNLVGGGDLENSSIFFYFCWVNRFVFFQESDSHFQIIFPSTFKSETRSSSSSYKKWSSLLWMHGGFWWSFWPARYGEILENGEVHGFGGLSGIHSFHEYAHWILSRAGQALTFRNYDEGHKTIQLSKKILGRTDVCSSKYSPIAGAVLIISDTMVLETQNG